MIARPSAARLHRDLGVDERFRSLPPSSRGRTSKTPSVGSYGYVLSKGRVVVEGNPKS